MAAKLTNYHYLPRPWGPAFPDPPWARGRLFKGISPAWGGQGLKAGRC